MVSEKNLKIIENVIHLFDSHIYRKKELLMGIDQVHRDLFYIRKGVPCWQSLLTLSYQKPNTRNKKHLCKIKGVFFSLNLYLKTKFYSLTFYLSVLWCFLVLNSISQPKNHFNDQRRSVNRKVKSGLEDQIWEKEDIGIRLLMNSLIVTPSL